ncbi:MAG: spermidine/putrescine ABC transporter substrate-binding protein [Candidatus Nanopelagicales bacterium]
MAAAACGARPPRSTAAGSGSEEIPARTQPDQSAQSNQINWSTWVGYIDTDDDGNRPTVDAFTAKTGIEVDYREDVNDNSEFDAKVRPQLEAGQDIGRDIVVLTDWMAAQWIRKGFAQRFDRAWVPNARNLIPRLSDVPYDPQRDQSLPWQSGYGGLGFNSDLLEELTGKSEIRTVAELWDPALKGRVTILSEMRDSIGVVMLGQGNDPADFTEDDFNAAAAELQEQIDSGQIRQVSGNDYIGAMENGDVVAAIAWSGDVAALGGPFTFLLPESGGMLWTDNMLVPAMAKHRNNAERLMNFYYDPKIAAEVAAYVQYICPVLGAKEEMERIDPALVDNPLIFPTEEDLNRVSVFKTLTSSEQVKYDQAFQSLIGN